MFNIFHNFISDPRDFYKMALNLKNYDCQGIMKGCIKDTSLNLLHEYMAK